MKLYAISFLTDEYRDEAFKYLMACTTRETYRGDALKAVGELAMVLPDDAYLRINEIVDVIKENLVPRRCDLVWNLIDRRGDNVKDALDCFTHMSCALKERFTDKISLLCKDVRCILLVFRSFSLLESVERSSKLSAKFRRTPKTV